MGKSKAHKKTELEELARERMALLKLELKRGVTNYKQAEKMFLEAQRNAPRGEIVTGWAGVVQ